MSKWKCKTPYCIKTCYTDVPDDCYPTNCVLDKERKPDWREEAEPTTNSSQFVIACNQLPKLTVEVFDREDCPAWAKYAAVDKNGVAGYFSEYPSNRVTLYQWMVKEPGQYQKIDGYFDSSDWQNSLIKRPEKNILPDWCKVGEWGYNPSRGLYFEIVEISDNHIEVKYPHITNECYRLTIEYFKECNPSQAHLRPYNTEEMQGLVGKIIESDKYVHFINTFDKVFTKVVTGGDKYTANELLAYGYTIDGKRCGKFEHIENGKWVE